MTLLSEVPITSPNFWCRDTSNSLVWGKSPNVEGSSNAKSQNEFQPWTRDNGSHPKRSTGTWYPMGGMQLLWGSSQVLQPPQPLGYILQWDAISQGSTQALSVEEDRSQLRKTESALERKRKQEKRTPNNLLFRAFANIAFSPIPHFPTSCNQHSILSLSTRSHRG